MRDLLIHELGARHVHWHYDDPSGVPEDRGDRAVRSAGRPAPAAEIRLRVRRGLTPKAA